MKKLMIYISLLLLGERKLFTAVRVARAFGTASGRVDDPHMGVFLGSMAIWMMILKRVGIEYPNEFKVMMADIGNCILGSTKPTEADLDIFNRHSYMLSFINYKKSPIFSLLQLFAVQGYMDISKASEKQLKRLLLLVNIFDGAYVKSRLYVDLKPLNNVNQLSVDDLMLKFSERYTAFKGQLDEVK